MKRNLDTILALALSMAAALAGPGASQGPEGGPGGAARIACGDLNGDRRPDVVLVQSGRPVRLFLADARGLLVPRPENVPSGALASRAVALLDVDDDGDTDIALACYGARNRLLRNVGEGRFEDVTERCLPDRAEATTSVAAGDLDGDGDADLLFGNDGSGDRMLFNAGYGHYRDASDRLPSGAVDTRAVALADVDRDGDLDILCAVAADDRGRGGRDVLYLNAGDGQFGDGTRLMPNNATGSADMVLQDLDGDGDLDLAVARTGSGRGARDTVHLATSRFLRGSRRRLPAAFSMSRSVAAGDVDGDGDVDLVFLDDAGAHLFRNDGEAFFVADPVPPAVPSDTDQIGLQDLDGDGDPDLIGASASTGIVLLHNAGDGSFAAPVAGAVAAWAGDAAGDVVEAEMPMVRLHHEAPGVDGAARCSFEIAGVRVELRDADGNGVLDDVDTDVVLVGETEQPAPFRPTLSVGDKLVEISLDPEHDAVRYRFVPARMIRWRPEERYHGRGGVRTMLVENAQGQVFQAVRIDHLWVPAGRYRILRAEIEHAGHVCAVDGRDMQPLDPEDPDARWGGPVTLDTRWRIAGRDLFVCVEARGQRHERYDLPEDLRVELRDGRGRLLRTLPLGDGALRLSAAEASDDRLEVEVVATSAIFGTFR